MHRRSYLATAVFVAFVVSIAAFLVTSDGHAAEDAVAPTDIAEFKQHIESFLAKHCVRCHGKKEQEADFFLHDIDGLVTGGKDIVRWEKVLEMLSLGDMPPEDEPQPDKIDTNRVTTWIAAELRKIGRGHDEGKLVLPHQANRISHEDLFSGENKGPAYSPARLWRKSPYIYSRFANQMRTEVSQPLLGLGGKGIQDFAILYADESTIKTMLRNSNLIADNLTSAERSHVNRILNVLFKEDANPQEEDIERAVLHLFEMIFQRQPTDEDRERYIEGLFQTNRDLGGLRIGMRSLIVGMLMSQEFVYRLEVGLGEKLADGRRRLSPGEIAYALSFAFYDKPDAGLLAAARDGMLANHEDVAREVRRILETEDEEKRYWNYPMYHRWGADYYEHSPRVLRFFQEFFGYAAVADVFKDKQRNGTHHANRLRKDADMLVLSVLEKDQNVLAELLTTNRYPMDYFKDDQLEKLLTGGNKRRLEHYKEKYGEQFDAIAKSGKWPGIDSAHVTAYNLDREQADAVRRDPGEILALPKAERAGMLTHPAWLVAHSGNFDNDPIRRGKWIREHLLADLVPDVPIAVDAKVPEDPHRTLRERLDIVRAAECWRCHKQMNPLGEAFESYDDFGRHREQILLGDVEGYLKEKRKYDGQKSNLEKELRKSSKEGNSDGQRRIADIKRRLAELVEPSAETKPVDASGELRGTGDPNLDGPVTGAVDLVHRLAKSERVRQSFVRHAFRYWMGRNETLDDSPTLIAADRAYVESGGSFKAMLVALLSSDSFLYRK